MSQQKKLELPERIREFRNRINLSQDELGERLGVSGNYISMIELGKKTPGPSLRKLFETLEQSPLYQRTGYAGGQSGMLEPFGGKTIPTNPMLSMLSTETLIQNVVDVADKLSQGDTPEKKQVVGSLRELLDEIEQRLLASSGELSEAQQLAMKAAKPGGSHETT
jgi:transcriptional regulator with XRE-family HTH domain